MVGTSAVYIELSHALSGLQLLQKPNKFIPLSSPVCSNAGVVDPTFALEALNQQKAILMDVCVMWHSTIELIKTTQLLDGDPTPSFCHTFLDSVTEWDLKKAAYTMEVGFHS
ncbi:hypothetical protein SAY86_018848 [Trapa natans]|uniref:Uncharacterized protein n=1 Tax=Trapa natans TaxID=22666 RepID=A0AAN7LNL5_TRANT|nr:hypothetical protein SAY86_018848 [Trapa natans]